MKGPFIVVFDGTKKVKDGFLTLKDALEFSENNPNSTAMSVTEFDVKESKTK